MPADHPSIAAKAWKAYNEASSADSQTQFIEKHLPLVKTVVDRIRPTLPPGVDMEDLYSVGVTGLISAVQKYDPRQSTTFVAFAMLHIRGAVMDELRRLDWMTRGCREKAKKLKDCIFTLEQRLGRAPDEDEICKELKISRGEYENLLEEIRPITFLQLDSEAYSEDSDSICLHEMISDEGQLSAGERLERKELIEILVERMQMLPDIPKKILAMYYFENMRIAEIAAVFGLTEGRISQIHTQTVLGLRAFMEKIVKPSYSQTCG